MSVNVPIGIDDFRTLREHGLTYVDKTHLVCELIDRPGAQAVLLPRPRRFGKSLALSMLRCFFEKRGEDFTHLFEDLAVWRGGERYRAHFQRYPVIQLGFADTLRARPGDLRWAVHEKIRDLFDEHRAVLESGALSALERERFGQILDGSAPPGLYQRALLDLSRALHHAHGEKVIVLIDEYDQPAHASRAQDHAHASHAREQPAHASRAQDHAHEATDFLHGFYATGLQGNPHLARAVLTGTLRVSRSSAYAGPGNLAVYTVLRSEFATCFGFTESEVEALLERAGRQGDRELLARWYGGYRFGEHAIYNPWSVLSYLADAQARMRPYWLLAAESELVRPPLTREPERLRPLFESLLAGESIESVLDEDVPLDRLAESRDALWSLLVFCGYLRADGRPGMDLPTHELSIPNREVRMLYRGRFLEWLGAAPDRPRSAAAPQPGAERPSREPAERLLREPRAERLLREPGADGPELGPELDDELQRMDGLQGVGRLQRRERPSGDPRQRRPDIVADADAFEDRLQQFFEDMRAHPGTASIGPAGAEPADDRPDANSEGEPAKTGAGPTHDRPEDPDPAS
jgi:hypothetical protein